MLFSNQCRASAIPSRSVTCFCLHNTHALLRGLQQQRAASTSNPVLSHYLTGLSSFTLQQRQQPLAVRQHCPQHSPLGQQQQQQQRRVQTHAVQVDVLLGNLSSISGWFIGAALLAGILLGLALAKLASNYLRKEADPYYATLENAELRTKVIPAGQLMPSQHQR